MIFFCVASSDLQGEPQSSEVIMKAMGAVFLLNVYSVGTYMQIVAVA